MVRLLIIHFLQFVVSGYNITIIKLQLSSFFLHFLEKNFIQLQFNNLPLQKGGKNEDNRPIP